MQWLRRRIRGGALIAALVLAGAFVSGCQTTAESTPSMMTTRPTLYEVRRNGPTPTTIAWFTDVSGSGGFGSGKIVFANGTIPEGAGGLKLDVFVMVGTVDATFDLCAAFKTELTGAQHATWSGSINTITGQTNCP